MRSLPAIAFGAVLFGAAGWSQTPKPADDADMAAKAVLARNASNALRSRTSSSSYGFGEYWLYVTIPAGGSLDLDSSTDYSRSDTVRVTVRCNDGNLADVVLGAYWSMPGAPLFNVAEVARGDSFYYRNVGGATFNTYGSQFRLRIINNGVTSVTLSQALLFTRVHD